MESEKRILVLDRKVLERIDEYRGDLSRAEFIEVCIDTSLEMAETPEARPAEEPAPRPLAVTAPSRPAAPAFTGTPATREEFEAFKKNTKDLIRALLDFFITFGLDMAPGKAIENPDALRNQLRSLLEGL